VEEEDEEDEEEDAKATTMLMLSVTAPLVLQLVRLCDRQAGRRVHVLNLSWS
jgi:hypothetical protein